MHITIEDIKDYLTEHHPGEDVIGVVSDPEVEGTFAARTKSNSGFIQDYMWITRSVSDRTPGTKFELLEYCEEGVEFKSWPPISGKLRFFV